MPSVIGVPVNTLHISPQTNPKLGRSWDSQRLSIDAAVLWIFKGKDDYLVGLLILPLAGDSSRRVMAGEVEESFSINFQAGSIHSGSISFGRFENEPLSWERRSSFSHNRYLEELEKCSKPGSVIEKKEILEAHFKKKGPFGNSSSVSRDGSDRTTSENDESDRIVEQGDFDSNEDGDYVQFDKKFLEDFEANEGGHYVQFGQRLEEDFEPNEHDHYIQFEQRFQEGFEPSEDDHFVQFVKGSQENFEPNEGSHYVQADEILDVSVYNEQSQTTRCEREDAFTKDSDITFSNLQSAMNNPNIVEDGNDHSITVDETHLAENETSNLPSSNNETSTEVKENHDDTLDTDDSLRCLNTCLTEPSEGVEKSAFHGPADLSPKLLDVLEAKPDPAVTSEVNTFRVQKSTPSRLSKDPARHHSRESPRRTNTEKKLSKLATSTRSVSKTSKVEVSKTGEKQICESKSRMGSKVKKAAESQSSGLKANSRGIQETKRLNPTVNSSSTKSDARSKAAAFNFKSNERAERRKEFYMKLEEKMQAKEVEMNQVQAISQEKTEAEIKKLRKSLNFKATPMPSFYHKAVPPRLDGNKTVSSNARTKKVQSKSRESEVDATLPSKSKAGNDQAAHESVIATETHNISVEKSATTSTSEACLTSPTPSPQLNCIPASAANNQISGKKERTKATSQKVRIPESYKGAKSHRNEGKPKGETPIMATR
ncbi:hypothetical protein L6164_026745 [Bauhinia variegata]|uniref:Uncharacterized protein n=1 Tax=Bauhinia variegata TaxID=167791 RepID=A0ACB9LRN2_BAUVA|nr:hypothetical protein L6164_026745 [Bauhinia variegata]